MKKIMVIGLGYVGLSLATLLSQHHTVVALDVNPDKVDAINKRQSPIHDKEIEACFATRTLTLTAYHTDKLEILLPEMDYVIVSVPTDYKVEQAFFDTSILDSVIAQVRDASEDVPIIIKSTIPIGYVNRIRREHGYHHIVFMPEFLRETKALYDNLYPSRIIVGYDQIDTPTEMVADFVQLLIEGSLKPDVPVLMMSPTEAEAVKLFSNTYLAMRVAYFNELDTFAEHSGLNAEHLIRGISLDPRIGEGYNNPSFGYGGYCLPKDTKQLLANYEGIPQNMMSAIITSNATRKDYIAHQIIDRIREMEQQTGQPATVGIYRLVMKEGSDNFRESSIIDIVKTLVAQGVSCLIYEPGVATDTVYGVPVCHDLTAFKEQSSLIVTNRSHNDLLDVSDKVYTRDLFQEN